MKERRERGYERRGKRGKRDRERARERGWRERKRRGREREERISREEIINFRPNHLTKTFASHLHRN